MRKAGYKALCIPQSPNYKLSIWQTLFTAWGNPYQRLEKPKHSLANLGRSGWPHYAVLVPETEGDIFRGLWEVDSLTGKFMLSSQKEQVKLVSHEWKHDRAAAAILKLWGRGQRTRRGTDSGTVELRSQLPAAACFWLVHLVRTITLYFAGGHYTWIFSHMHLNIVLTDTIHMPSTFEQSNYFPFTVIF